MIRLIKLNNILNRKMDTKKILLAHYSLLPAHYPGSNTGFHDTSLHS